MGKREKEVAKSKHTKVDVFRTLERESLGCVIDEANYPASKNQRERHCLWCFEDLEADKEGLLGRGVVDGRIGYCILTGGRFERKDESNLDAGTGKRNFLSVPLSHGRTLV